MFCKITKYMKYIITDVFLNLRYTVLSELSSQPSSCYQILQTDPSKRNKDGIYKIHVGGQEKDVLCDMTTGEGGWTVSSCKIQNFNINRLPFCESILT
jgi:hypothetical protein